MTRPFPSRSILDEVRRHLVAVAGLTDLDAAPASASGSPPGSAPAAKPLSLADAAPGSRTFRLATAPDRPLSLQIDQHYPLAVHGLVLDLRLGSIGLVHFLPEPAPGPGPADPAALEHEINRIIENAAYLRHLLALKRSAAGEPMDVLLPAIEVVFLARDDAAPRSALAEHLRRSLRESALLHALSVGVAFVETTDAARMASQLRRAFCWLLPATEAWLRAIPPAATAPVAWDGLRLKNFRRPGVRTWQKTAAPSRLHVIHGPNGSGKSSLAEGFEYVVTAGSTRLKSRDNALPLQPDPAQRADHFAPLIYRDGAGTATGAGASPNLAPRAAEAELLLGGTTLHHLPVPPPDDTRPRVDFPGGALRMDQKLVDQLSLSGSSKRAHVWLKTFFSDFDRERTERREARRRLRAAIAVLAPSDEADTPERLLGALLEQASRLTSGTPVLLADLLLPLLGPEASSVLDLPRLGELGLQLPNTLALLVSAEPEDREHGWDPARREVLREQARAALAEDAAVLEHWRELDHAALRGLLEDLGRRGFDESAGTLRARVSDGPDYPTTFNRHLRVVALIDLLERALVIARTAAALPSGAGDPLLDQLRPALPADEIAGRLDTLRKERDELQRRIADWTRIERAERGETAPAALGAAQLDQLLHAVTLNTFSPLLAAEDAKEFAELLGQQRPGRVRELAVGAPDWSAPLVAILRQREAALAAFGDTLLQRPSRAKRPGSRVEERAAALVDLVDGVVALARLERKSARRFQDIARDVNLAPAIEELLALLTPARWAYPALTARIETDEGADQRGERFDLESRGIDVGLVLNTAELNTLALVLYLLCAPRVDNPYRVLFLDDPLQNMDELTVATVARTLARLLRLWSQVPGLGDWDLVVLLHGEENCQRLLLDAPAAYYRLPWLPMHGGTVAEDLRDDDVTPAPGTERGSLISLKGFFAEM